MKSWQGVACWSVVMAVVAGGTAWAATITVDTFDPAVAPDGYCSLIEAMENANDDAATNFDCVAGDGADSIELQLGDYVLTSAVSSVFGGSGLPAVTGDLTINGRSRLLQQGSGTEVKTTVIEREQGAQPFRVFYVTRGARLMVNDVTVRNGATDSWGGGALNFAGSLIMNRCRVLSNVAADGGGLANLSGTVLLIDTVVSGNRCSNDGGGISNRAVASEAALIALRSTVSDNMAARFGGGIKNDASAGGSSKLKLIETTVRDNQADDSGGGIGQQPGTDSGTMELEVLGGAISGNVAREVGGGVGAWVAGSGRQIGRVEIRGAEISDNQAKWGGGLLGWYLGSSIVIAESTFDGNLAADGWGGGLVVGAGATLDLQRSTISANVAEGAEAPAGSGGGLGVINATATVALTTISGNRAMRSGGGIYVATDEDWGETGSSVTVADCTIVENAAVGSLGGGLNVERYSGSGSAELQMVGSILGMNRDVRGSGNCKAGFPAALVSEGSNVTDDFTCGLYPVGEGAGSHRQTAPGDLVVQDLMLSDLGDFGGPTLTHMPLDGSPVIDIGSGGGLRSPVDQRGYLRMADGDGDGGCVCDAGAVEAGSVEPSDPDWDAALRASNVDS